MKIKAIEMPLDFGSPANLRHLIIMMKVLVQDSKSCSLKNTIGYSQGESLCKEGKSIAKSKSNKKKNINNNEMSTMYTKNNFFKKELLNYL